MREEVKLRKVELEESKIKLLGLRDQATEIKMNIQEKLEYFETCQ
jgi:hypothetical protein